MMTTANWRTNIGGALGALGTTLIGVGVVPQLSGTPNKLLTVTAVAGFFISAAGKFFTALFAADARVVADLGTQVAANATAIAATVTAVQTGDTTMLTKADVVPTSKTG